jgi:hypothetical protein
VTNRETCYNLVPSDYPVTISKVSVKRKKVELQHVFTSTVKSGYMEFKQVNSVLI